MFVIVTYDVAQKRVTKTMRICRKYLTHVQNSVFEGIITEANLNKLKNELKKVIVPADDSIYIYEIHNTKYTRKESIGVIRHKDNIL